MTISRPAASLVGFLLETMLYGGYVVVFYEHLKILRRRRTNTWTFRYQAGTTIALFLTITMRTVVDILQAVEAYTEGEDPNVVITGYRRILNKLKIGLYSAEILNADLFLVYRIYILWGRRWMVAFVPFAMWAVVLAFNIWANLSLLSTAPNTVGHSKTSTLAKFPLIGTTVLNVVCTTLIAGRIWWIQRANYQYDSRLASTISKDPATRALNIIIESASIYVGCLIALVTTQVLTSPVYFMILAFISPVVGLVFSIIIVRSCSDTSIGSTARPHTQTLSLRFQSAPRANRTGFTEDSFSSGAVAEEGLAGRDSALPHGMTEKEKEKNAVGFKFPSETRGSDYDLPA